MNIRLFSNRAATGMPTIICGLTLMIACYATPAFAQISLGGHIGIDFLNMYSDDPNFNDAGLHPLTRIHATAACAIDLNEYLAVQPELMYGTHGVKIYSVNDWDNSFFRYSDSQEGYLQVHNIEAPILLKAKFGNGDWKFHLVAGPSIGFGLRSKSHIRSREIATDKFLGTNTVVDESINLYNRFLADGYNINMLQSTDFPTKRLNFNLHLGAGVGYEFDAFMIYFETRFMLGISDMLPDDAGSNPSTERSRRFALNLGVMTPL